MVSSTVLARGIRNNNPGNMLWDGRTQWQGMTGQDEKGFIIFDTPENGIRAMARNLQSYQRRGLDTIVEILSEWAPDHENDSIAYIMAVGRRTGLDINQPLTSDNYPALIAAIIRHENGVQPYSVAQIENGISKAVA